MPLLLSQEEIDDLILPCLDSTALTAVTLFEDHFTRPFCTVHNQIFEIIDDDAFKLVAIAAPRGFGKTTTIGLGFIGRLALFRLAPYIVYISSTASEAAAKVKTLAKELQENSIIKELFGDLKGVKWAEEKGEIELSDDKGAFCFIQAKGAGSQVRGLKWGKHRPSIFLVDDLEDAEDVMNEMSRAKLKEWFFADLLGARDQASTGKTRVVLIGTVLHEDSLLANLIDESDKDEEEAEINGTLQMMKQRETFKTLRLEACDDEFRSVWPEYLTDDELKFKAAMYEKRGLLDVFYREWRNIVIAKGASAFQKSMFRYYSEQRDKIMLTNIENVVIVDPAKTANTTSAFTAILGIGFDSANNRILVRDALNARLTPDMIFEEAFNMADRLGTHTIAIEVTGLNNFITYPMQQAAALRPKFYDIHELKATKDKDLRIAALSPFYRMGAVYHNEDVHVHGTLETQLLSFPRSKFKDVMDCLANCIDMFDLGNRTFSYQGAGREKTAKPFTIEDEYEELKIEDRADRKTVKFRIV